ncbi:hypothetical protein [Salmonella phage SW16-7]|nr:hypothetical protein [Salmonella phage SW16-7]
MLGIIYLLKINNKIYIGQTRNGFQQRFREHIQEARRGNKAYLYNCIRKYGEEAISYEILEECPVGYLNEREIYYIELHKSHISQGGMNISKGGQIDISGMAAAFDINTRKYVGMKPVDDEGWGVLFVAKQYGVVHREESRLKMSASQQAVWTEEKKKSQSQLLKEVFKDPEKKKNLKKAMDKLRSGPSFQNKVNAGLGREFILISPDGEKYEIKNLLKFCKERELCSETFNMALAGRKPNPIPAPYRKSSTKRTNTSGWSIQRK